MKIIKPPKLKEGDTVGVITPSSYILEDLRSKFDIGIKVLEEEYGLKVKLGEHVFDQYFYSAGTAEDRLKDLHAMFRDQEVKAVIPSLGGESINQMLDKIDYDLIKQNPKIICGISDGSMLINAIHSKTGLITYHGPDVIFTFGRNQLPAIRENIRKSWFDGEVGQIKPLPKWEHEEDPKLTFEGWSSVRSGKASGTLIGGHLGVTMELELTRMMPDFKDAILFLEGTDPVADIDRQLTALKLAGVFDKISGLILGWFEWRFPKNDEEYREIRDIILEVTRDYDFPILEIGELGHNVPNYVFPIGCQATIDADRLYFSVDEPAVV
ncbi:LD-carboxypeptidase [Patescibacteria group bacterium]